MFAHRSLGNRSATASRHFVKACCRASFLRCGPQITSSTFLERIVGAMFMRVNSKCAHQVRPPPSQLGGYQLISYLFLVDPARLRLDCYRRPARSQ
jgi:hypothetical protein